MNEQQRKAYLRAVADLKRWKFVPEAEDDDTAIAYVQQILAGKQSVRFETWTEPL